MRAAALALAGLALASCAGDRAEPQTFAGVYRIGFETQAFWPAEGGGPYWVEGDKASLAALAGAVSKANGGLQWGGIAVEVEGLLSPPGKYGHLEAYGRSLRVTRVKATRPLDESLDTRG